MSDQPPQRNHVTKSAGVSDLDNFWREILLKNCTFPTTYPKIFTKSCWEGPSFVGCTFLIHSLFFPAFPSFISDLPRLLFLFPWSVSILFSLLRIHILSSSTSAFMLYSPTEQPISSSCTSCMALAHAMIELQFNKAAGMLLYQLHSSFLSGSNSKRDHRRTRHFTWHNADIVERDLCWPSTCR